MLTPDEEVKALKRAMSNLPPRHGILVFGGRGRLEFIRTPSIPYAQAYEVASAAPQAIRAHFRLERNGDSLPEPKLLLKQTAETKKLQPKRRRGKLVLP